MKPHISVKAKVMQYLLDNEDVLLEAGTIAKDLNITLKQVTQNMYTICTEADSVVKQKRGVWIYNPSEPVKVEEPVLHRLHSLLQQGDAPRDVIAEKLGISNKEVSALTVRMNRELGVKVHSTLIYSIKDPSDEASNSTN
ncbi:hypothetical protein VPHD292_0063 [Vibrio phage D292]